MNDTGVTKVGEELVREWWAAKQRAQRLRDEASRADTEARNAELELSRWLLPSDAVQGEKVGVWFIDSLVQATAESFVGNGWTGPVIIRTAGKKFLEVFR